MFNILSVFSECFNVLLIMAQTTMFKLIKHCFSNKLITCADLEVKIYYYNKLTEKDLCKMLY